MVVAGYAVEVLFRVTGLTPQERRARVIEAHVGWNYTTWLDLVFLAAAAVLVARILSTGGPAMLRMMGGAPAGADQHGHDHH